MRQSLWLLPVLAVLFGGCAYFNTFYNAKMYYNRAAKLTEKDRIGSTSSQAQNDYQLAVEKALLLLENYPNSKWEDDALLLLGKSYYRLKDYPSGERRLTELIAGYPSSQWLTEAKFWMAKVKASTGRYSEAENDILELTSKKISKKYKGEILLFQGQLYESRREFEKAIESYRQALDADAGTWGAKAWYGIGSDYDSLGSFDQSAAAFRQVLKFSPDPEMEFDAQFRSARAQKKLGVYNEAIRTLEKMQADEKNKTKNPVIRLEIADCLNLKGDIDGALVTYQDIVQSNPNTEYSAESLYWIGDLYEKDKNDYDRALESYSQVKKQGVRSVYTDSAEIRGRDILRLNALRQVIQMAVRGEKGDAIEVGSIGGADTGIDTLIAAARDSSLKTGTPDVLSMQNQKPPSGSDDPIDDAPTKKIQTPAPIAENPELKSFNKDEFDKNLFLLAELYLFRFQIPDSALVNYNQLTNRFPDSPFTPQALYNMGYLFDNSIRDSSRADSCYKILVKRHPDSPYARGVLKRLKLERIASQEDSAAQIFDSAEKMLFTDKNPDRSVREYLSIWKRFPKTEIAPKALYSAGWVYENALNFPDQAFILYDSLMSRYPGSPYSGKVQKKVEAVKTEKSKPVQPEQKQMEGNVPENPSHPEMPTDSSGTSVRSDSLNTASKTQSDVPSGKMTTPIDSTGRILPPGRRENTPVIID